METIGTELAGRLSKQKAFRNNKFSIRSIKRREKLGIC